MTEPKSGHGLWPFQATRRRPDGQPAARVLSARQVRQAVEAGELVLTDVWQSLALGNWRQIELTAMGLALESDLLYLLAQNSLKPALRTWAQGASQEVDLAHWRRGYCPMCGSQPSLAEIQGKEGARRLRCGLCGASWPYPRLQCAFCTNADYRLLGYVSVTGEEEKYSLQTCDACHRYLKVVVTFDPLLVDMLPVEDLATLHLDLIAAERHYSRLMAN